jgi:type III pantothenate kinase
LVRRIAAELGSPLTAVIATGGLAPVVLPECETVTDHRPDLTLVGLRIIFQRNT